PLVGQDVALLTVHDQVDTGDLVLGGDAESDGLLDREADHQGDHEGVDEHAARGQHLHDQQTPVATGEQTLTRGEEAQVDGADHAADEVQAHDVERVVEAPAVLQVDGQRAQHTGDGAEQQGPAGCEVGARGGDG